MNCKTVNEYLDLFREDSLDQATEEQITEHLGLCSACRTMLGKADALDRALKTTLPPPAQREGFAARVLARLPDEELVPPHIARIVWMRPLLATAACLLLAACAIIYHPRSEDPDPVTVAATTPREIEFVEPAAHAEYAIGSAFVITNGELRPFEGSAPITVTDIINGVPQLTVDAFPEA